MGSKRLNGGERIASVSAFVLLISMFLDWFVIEVPGTTGVIFFLDGTGQSAWESLNVTPVVLSVTVVAALALAASRLAGLAMRSVGPANALVATLGFISILLIGYRIVDPPGANHSFEGFMGATVTAQRTVQFGIFLGLLAAAGIALGSFWATIEARTFVRSSR